MQKWARGQTYWIVTYVQVHKEGGGACGCEWRDQREWKTQLTRNRDTCSNKRNQACTAFYVSSLKITCPFLSRFNLKCLTGIPKLISNTFRYCYFLVKLSFQLSLNICHFHQKRQQQHSFLHCIYWIRKQAVYFVIKLISDCFKFLAFCQGIQCQILRCRTGLWVSGINAPGHQTVTGLQSLRLCSPRTSVPHAVLTTSASHLTDQWQRTVPIIMKKEYLV